MWAIGYLVVVAGLWKLMDELYFGFLGDYYAFDATCDTTFGSTAKRDLEYFVGYAPTYYRGSLLLFAAKRAGDPGSQLMGVSQREKERIVAEEARRRDGVCRWRL